MERIKVVEGLQQELELVKKRIRVALDPDVREFSQAVKAIQNYEDAQHVKNMTPWFCTPQHLPIRPGVYMTSNDPTIDDSVPSTRYRKFFGGQMWSAEFVGADHADKAASTLIMFPFLWRGLNHG